MGLKMLHSADWHLDAPFLGLSQEQRQFLKNAQRKIPEKVTDLCRREGCDLMLLAGDLFDGEPSRETVQMLKKELERAGVPVLIAPGNHDYCAPGSPWVEESWPENVHIFTGKLESVPLPGLDCRIYGAGFQSMDCLGLLEGLHIQGTERYHIGVFHGDPIYKKSPYNPISVSQVKQSDLHYLALGHIHKAGAFRAGSTFCAWPGCPMGRGWDETGDKGVCIVTLRDQAQVKAVSLDLPRFLELEADVGSDALTALEAVLPAGGSRDFLRVTLTGCGEIDMQMLYRELAAYPHLELRDKTEPPVELWANSGEDTLEGVYFRMLRQSALEDPENEEIIRLAAEISRKILQGREVTL